MKKRAAFAFVLALVLVACGKETVTTTKANAPSIKSSAAPGRAAKASPKPLNVYAATMAGTIIPRLAGLAPRVYVPNGEAQSIDVIDPATMKIVDHFSVGVVPHHVFPAWDMHALFVGNTASNTLTELDIHTGKPVRTIPVPDPYNLYWTFGSAPVRAMVIAERFNRIDFRDPITWALIKSVPIPWAGIDHGDFTADGRYWFGSTEYDGVVVKIDTVAMQLAGSIKVGGLPVDVRLSPDGTFFTVANQGRMGISFIDPATMKETGFLPTGRGAHGFQVSRDTKNLYIANRLAGTISVMSYATRQIIATWSIGGSPDMMQLSPDGKQLWVSGRYNSAVYVVDTATGSLIKTFHVGAQAHGLTYFPAPGRFCTGHNGVYR